LTKNPLGYIFCSDDRCVNQENLIEAAVMSSLSE